MLKTIFAIVAVLITPVLVIGIIVAPVAIIIWLGKRIATGNDGDYVASVICSPDD